MTDIHALISAFLQEHPKFSPGQGEGDDLVKAGIVPFLSGAPLQFYVMKPVARHSDLGEPPFQLCKGTRQFKTAGGWKDMRDGKTGAEKEPLVATALREGIEELGLVLENILQLLDVGTYSFASATTGKKRHMRMFAAKMASRENFLPDADIAATTHARKWLSAAEFAVVGRDDHRYILADINVILSAAKDLLLG